MSRLVAISYVRNERDIIEAFIRHHAHHLDLLIVRDNGSTDGTYETLCALRDEGLALVVERDESLYHSQGRAMTALLDRALRDYQPDWVFPLDADEFLEPRPGRSMAETMAALPPTLFALRWANFAWRPLADGERNVNPIARLTHRTRLRDDMSKLVIPGGLVRGCNVKLDEGNHDLFVDGNRMSAEICHDLTLCHFPIRSIDQYAAKVAVAHLKHTANADRLAGHGEHHAFPFVSLRKGLTSLEELMEETSRRYSLDPTRDFDDAVTHEPFRYAAGEVPPEGPLAGPLSDVLTHAEGLAHGYAAEVRAARAARADAGDAEAAAAALRAELDVMKAEARGALAEIERLQAEGSAQVLQARADIEYLTLCCRDKDAHIEGLRARIDALLASTSWRLTAPIRAIRSLPGSLTRRPRLD